MRAKEAGVNKLVEQVLRFGVVGMLAFVVDYGLLMLLSQALGMNAVLAAAISFCVSLVFNYFASMRYVFKRRENISRSREFATFVLLSMVGLVINEVVMWLGTTWLGGSALAVSATKVVATGIVMVWNFWSRRHWLDAGR